MTNLELITAIERFARDKGIAPASVTSRAVGNSRLYHTLKNGGSCTLTLAERLVKHMESNGFSVHAIPVRDKTPLPQGPDTKLAKTGDAA